MFLSFVAERPCGDHSGGQQRGGARLSRSVLWLGFGWGLVGVWLGFGFGGVALVFFYRFVFLFICLYRSLLNVPAETIQEDSSEGEHVFFSCQSFGWDLAGLWFGLFVLFVCLFVCFFLGGGAFVLRGFFLFVFLLICLFRSLLNVPVEIIQDDSSEGEHVFPGQSFGRALVGVWLGLFVCLFGFAFLGGCFCFEFFVPVFVFICLFRSLLNVPALLWRPFRRTETRRSTSFSVSPLAGLWLGFGLGFRGLFTFILFLNFVCVCMCVFYFFVRLLLNVPASISQSFVLFSFTFVSFFFLSFVAQSVLCFVLFRCGFVVVAAVVVCD